MLRAVRFAAKLDFAIAADTADPIKQMAYLLHQVAPPRLFEEVLKLFLKGCAEKTFDLLLEHHLFQQLFPATAACLQNKQALPIRTFIQQAMRNSDMRLAQQKTLTPAFILAVLLWHPLLQNFDAEKALGLPEMFALENAIRVTLKKQQQLMTIPKRFSQGMIDIWKLQFRLQKRPRRSLYKILEHPRFRAGYDFLLLRVEAGENINKLADWWTLFYDADEKQRAVMQKKLATGR
jgi:poly(A) polymerase